MRVKGQAVRGRGKGVGIGSEGDCGKKPKRSMGTKEVFKAY